MNQTTENSPINPANAVRILNAHHLATSAGFYGSRIGGRYFRARFSAGKFEVFDFDTWREVAPADMAFHDHNGRDICLRNYKERAAGRKAAKIAFFESHAPSTGFNPKTIRA